MISKMQHCYFAALVGAPLLKDLHNHITPHYAAKWRDIGVQLRLPKGALDIIEHDNHHKAIFCCNSMLEKWLEVDHDVTWSKLLDVIQSPAVSHAAYTGNLLQKQNHIYVH